jgi:hypothetical protein
LSILSKDGSAFTPGGDFFWLRKSFYGQGYDSPGNSHGHNVVAVEFGLNADPVLPMAPGDGSVEYLSSWLGCTSCHDPHGATGDDAKNPAAGGFRLLGGVDYAGGNEAVGISFTNPAPVARSYSGLGNKWPAETDQNHTDYGSGMSEWCTNCHSGFASGLTHGHPAGNHAHLRALAMLYDGYVASGNMTGTHDAAYDHFVPFERGVENPIELSPTSTEGPEYDSNVMCLTCHRAHASPFAASGRWDFQSTLLEEGSIFNYPDGVNAYYGENIETRYTSFQRSLCNKCHVRD